jgi:hypothetical protein
VSSIRRDLEFLWRGTGPALGAVDDDEIRCDARREDRLADRQELGPGANAQLDSDGLAAGQPPQYRDELQEFSGCGERTVRRRRDHGAANRHITCRRDLRAKKATMPAVKAVSIKMSQGAPSPDWAACCQARR